MRIHSFASLTMLALAGCTLAIPEGQYACVVAETDCPGGWSCVLGRCVSSPATPGGDAGAWTGDASRPSDSAAADAFSITEADAATIETASDAGTTSPPDAAAAPEPATDLAVGARHACVATAAGLVLCWGDNAQGALGASPSTLSSGTPLAVPDVPESHAVCAGTGFSCALGADARVRCWGVNDLWQLGRAGTSPGLAAEVPGVASASAIACGGAHACAVTATGVLCWGDNGSAQTGAASSPRELPHVVGITLAVAITAGAAHTCALLADQSVSCWGSAAMGQLGPFGPTPSALAMSAAPISLGDLRAVSLAAGAQHSCVARTDGDVACWGRADAARLGIIATGPHPHLEVVSGASAMRLVAGGDELSCAASATGPTLLSCWGSLAYGGLGTGGAARTGAEPTPMPVASMPPPVTRLEAGSGFACAVSEPLVFCWGLNDRGQLGDGTTTMRTAPVEVVFR